MEFPNRGPTRSFCILEATGADSDLARFANVSEVRMTQHGKYVLLSKHHVASKNISVHLDWLIQHLLNDHSPIEELLGNLKLTLRCVILSENSNVEFTIHSRVRKVLRKWNLVAEIDLALDVEEGGEMLF
jgi:hypothetical protein